MRGGAEKIMIVDPRPELNGRTLAQVAEAWGTSVPETVRRILRDGEAAVMNLDLYDIENIRYLATKEWMMTGTDGRTPHAGQDIVHPRVYGAFTRKLRLFALDEHALELPEAVLRSTYGPSLAIETVAAGEPLMEVRIGLEKRHLPRVCEALRKRGAEPSAPAKFGLALAQMGLANLVLVWGAEAYGVAAMTPSTSGRTFSNQSGRKRISLRKARMARMRVFRRRRQGQILTASLRGAGRGRRAGLRPRRPGPPRAEGGWRRRSTGARRGRRSTRPCPPRPDRRTRCSRSSSG